MVCGWHSDRDRVPGVHVTGEDLCAYIDLRLFNNAGVRRNARLMEARGFRFTEALGADGGGSFTCAWLADTLPTDWTLLETGFAKAALVLTAGAAPVEVFGWELVPSSGSASGEKGQWDVTSSGPGLRHLFEYAALHPESGTWDKNTEDVRYFGWMSYPSAYWYDPADWSTPATYGPVKLAGNRTGEKITADTTPAVDDINLGRTAFNLATAAAVDIYWQCDDEGTLYVDSKQADVSQQANTTQKIRLGLSAGDHNIAIEVTNTINPECGFACLVVNVGTNTVIRRTDTTNWVTHKVVGGVKPGMSAGAILRTVLDEAQSVGQDVHGLDLLTPDFDGQDDSNSSAWTDLQEVAFPLGTSMGEIVRHLEELDCEVRVKPDFTFQAFKEQGTDVSATVWLQPGVNVLSRSWQGAPVTGTVALVRTVGGWVTVTNSAGVTANGRRYIAITSGTSASTAQGARLGARAMDETAQAQYVYTVQFRATADCMPWQDFFVGSTITSEDRRGAMVPMDVLSISAETPDDAPGPVLFTVELLA
jgi:hypothetical protein